MQKIITFLTFDNQAEEAMNFYTSVFPNSRITNIWRYGKAGPGKEGDVMAGMFEIEGQQFYTLNAGPHFKFSLAISLFVNCNTQEEIDRLWAKLIEGGGKEIQCGWLTDKYGVTWQIVPTVLMEMQADKNPDKVAAVMQAMMKMVKLDIGKLKEAYEKG
jgi:predicted 3-demethylubiquinone-9 3-methyltransferase (glyoxalase superfamily)